MYNKAGVLYWMDKIHNILYEIRKIELSTFDHSEIYLQNEFILYVYNITIHLLTRTKWLISSFYRATLIKIEINLFTSIEKKT